MSRPREAVLRLVKVSGEYVVPNRRLEFFMAYHKI